MAVTYKTAADRDAQQRARSLSGRHIPAQPLELLLAGVSLFAAALFFFTYEGVVSRPRTDGAAAPVVNLNSSPTAEQLGSVLDQVFPSASDRRLAVQQLVSFLTNEDGGHRQLPMSARSRERVCRRH